MDKLLEADAMPGYESTTVAKPAVTRKPKSKPAVRVKPVPTTTHNPAVTRWAAFGVGFTLALSAGLNGYSNAQHSPVAWAGWLMGLAVPVLVLTLSKVAGEKWLKGQRRVAYFAGGSGAALLFLSVWHCSQAIAVITGSPLLLAAPLAIAVDCGLVALELALITEPRNGHAFVSHKAA